MRMGSTKKPQRRRDKIERAQFLGTFSESISVVFRMLERARRLIGYRLLMAGSQENTSHIPLDLLWRFRSNSALLSKDELNHLCNCNECLNSLSMCQSCETLEQVKALQQRKMKSVDE